MSVLGGLPAQHLPHAEARCHAVRGGGVGPHRHPHEGADTGGVGQLDAHPGGDRHLPQIAPAVGVGGLPEQGRAEPRHRDSLSHGTAQISAGEGALPQAVAALGLAGAPLTAGFIAKYVSKESLGDVALPALPAVALAVGNTAGALLSVRFAIEAPGAIRWVVLAAVLVAVAAAWLR